MNELWNKIIYELRTNPRDIKTIPLNRKGKWFYAYSDGNSIFVTYSRQNKPSCNISIIRKLKNDEFESMINLYKRRCRGEQVSYEATNTTVNQVYWYGIFNCFFNI